MAKPLISEDIGQPKSVQFAHFGVLNDGAQSKTSTMTAVVINVLLAIVIVIVGAATKKTIDKRMKLTELTAPIPIKPIEPIRPKIVPPKIKMPDVPKIQVQTPKIIVPDVKLPDPPKMVKMDTPKPMPVMTPAPPKQVVAMAAPAVVHLAAAAPALVNNSAHPTAVALGSQSNPLAAQAAGPSAVNLGNKGAAGMPSSNTGLGRPTTVNLAGSGTPGGSNKGTGAVAVAGIPHGVPGGTGPLNSTGHAVGVNMAQATPPPMPKATTASAPVQHSSPKVIFKPKPEYSAEAKEMHLEGTVTVHIHVLPNGTVEVVGVTDGLGHGLDESARRAAQATRFEPATDASGHPIEWDGFVKVAFQLAG
jgi:periplasmic protein TonB